MGRVRSGPAGPPAAYFTLHATGRVAGGREGILRPEPDVRHGRPVFLGCKLELHPEPATVGSNGYSAEAGQPNNSNKKRCEVLPTIARVAVAAFIAISIAGCGQTSAIQATDKSNSHFADAAFKGETVVLSQPTKGNEQFRLFQQGATGYVSLQSVRDDVELRAVQFCERKSQSMNALQETTSTPPHILGNFPRAELVFECVAKAAPIGSTSHLFLFELFGCPARTSSRSGRM